MPFLPLATTASNSRIFFWLSVSSASIVLGCDVKVRPDGDGMRRRDSAAVGNAYRIGGGSGTVKERLVKVAAMPAARTRRAGSAAMIVRGFAAIAGHERTITMLRAHQAAGRLAHAYCLIGEEGLGKTAVARALAEELLLGEGQPSRLEVHPDFWSDDRPEAISIDEIRFHPEKGAPAHDQSLQQFLSLKPFVAPLRVGLLANAERMTEAAQNCLLKTLEEPPPNTVLVLTTAYPDHLLSTCLSRCQVIAASAAGQAGVTGGVDRSGLGRSRPGSARGGPTDPVADRSECESSSRHGSHAARPAHSASAMSRVFVTLPLPSPGIDMLKDRFEVSMMEAEGMPPETLKRHIADADPVGIVGMVNVPITDEIMAAAPNLRVVANYAVGYNNVDVAAATRRAVLVTNTPGVLTQPTADLAFALLLAVARRVVESDRFLRQGKFKGWKADLLLGSDVYGRVLGIIGFGRIGQALARRGLGFNMSILDSDARRVSPEVESQLRAQYLPLHELLRKADYVSIQADLNEQTRHLIGERELKLMGPEHYLINAARGPIVDEKALVRALKEGWIKGAGLDVYEHEPKTEPGLTDCWNAVLLPHLGSATVTARAAMAETAAKNLIAAVDGQTPPNLVNPEALAVRR